MGDAADPAPGDQARQAKQHIDHRAGAPRSPTPPGRAQSQPRRRLGTGRPGFAAVAGLSECCRGRSVGCRLGTRWPGTYAGTGRSAAGRLANQGMKKAPSTARPPTRARTRLTADWVPSGCASHGSSCRDVGGPRKRWPTHLQRDAAADARASSAAARHSRGCTSFGRRGRFAERGACGKHATGGAKAVGWVRYLKRVGDCS